tara:strand:- start:1205 stop:1336 length:132 start_codon:yes stop_codon:yes gene_type:complete
MVSQNQLALVKNWWDPTGQKWETRDQFQASRLKPHGFLKDNGN